MTSKADAARRAYRDLVNVAIENGATRAKLIPAEDIFVDERVRLKCLAPLCDNYNRHLLCPPNIMTVDQFRRVASAYSHAVLVQVDAPYDSKDDPSLTLSARARRKRDSACSEKCEVRVHKIVNEVERAAFKKGFYLAAGLIASHCMLCSQCVGAGRMCRHPFEARPSMQALGIDVIKTSEKAGMPVTLSSSSSVRWTCLVLVD